MQVEQHRTGLEHATVALADGTVVLTDLTLLARGGEVLTILGPSGSGKSSILRAIAGLEQLRSGQVVIDGEPVPQYGSRDVAMVFQDAHLIPFMDAARNMLFPLDLAGVPREEARRRVEREAGRFGLRRLLRHRPAELSPGQTARVSLGRAMVRAPKVFLLDEPLAHLDAGARVEMRQELRTIVSQTGVTTFFVTHDQSDAMSVGDRIAVIDQGRLLQVATGRELYESPATARVADLVAPGRISLVPADLVVADGMTGYRIGGRTVPTWSAPSAALRGGNGRRVLVGIHPEDVHEQPAAEHGTITGVVGTIEPLGSYTSVGIAVDDHVIFARFAPDTGVRPGDRVTVGVDAARALVFDADTGARLADRSSP